MNDRQALILEIIIAEYIKTGLPVSSQLVVEHYPSDLSSATIRNEMADLEDQGFIAQPYTSAGRVPTEMAYKWYITKLNNQKLGAKETNRLAKTEATNFKQTAKDLAELSGLAVVWATDRNQVYYTGLTNLLTQPEFEERDLVCHISAVIDNLDNIINEYFDKIDNEPLILIGSEGPFGDFCSSIMIKYRHGNQEGAFGVLGPLRMDYGRNLGLINYIYKQLR